MRQLLHQMIQIAGISLGAGRRQKLGQKSELDLFERLAELDRSLNLWSSKFSTETKSTASIKAFPEFQTLACLLVEILRNLPCSSWSEHESVVFNEVLIKDWHSQELLYLIEESELFDIATASYKLPSLRMYMLTRASKCSSKNLRENIFLHVHRNDSNDTVRDFALVKLAKEKWSGTRDIANEYWHSGDYSKQITALEMLSNYDKNLLDKFAEKALAGNDDRLKLIATHFQKSATMDGY